MQQPIKRRASATYTVPQRPDTNEALPSLPDEPVPAPPRKSRRPFLFYVGVGMVFTVLWHGLCSSSLVDNCADALALW
jgi:hypothetical protein